MQHIRILKKYFKKSSIVRGAISLYKKFKQNPNFIEWVEQKMFGYRHGTFILAAPTPQETALIHDLRVHIEQLPVETPNDSTPPPERKWMNYKNKLREMILTADPREFRQWEVTAWAMGSVLHRADFKKLSNMPFWSEWSRRLMAFFTHSPCHESVYFKFPYTGGDILQQVYHLAQLRTHFDKDVSRANFIVEFGGGYGAMCVGVHALGFTGTYLLFDSPEFLLLQKFYLQLHGIDTSRIRFVSTLSEVKQEAEGKRGLVIGMWSLSEVSEELRNSFFACIDPEAYLIGYQRSFGGVENYSYFQHLTERRQTISWRDYPIPGFTGAGNRYLLGNSIHQTV